MVVLRPYQTRTVDAIRSALVRSRAVCLALQVGGGKTVIACEVIRRALARGRRCLFVVHRIELVEQARDRLAAFGIAAGIIKAGFPERRDEPVQVACVPTLIRREFPAAELVILDECHHSASDSWGQVVGHYRAAGAWLLGITATPQRLDGKPLRDAFAEIIEPVTTRELIRDGFLLEPLVYAPPSISRAGLRVRGGDYALPELAIRMAKLTGSITEYWSRYCRGRRTLAFAVNVAHSRLIEDALREAGARVAHVDGTSRREARAAANVSLRDGSLDVVTQCQIWTEGLDIPELECLIVARPTKSLSLHRQMIGRVMRPSPGKPGALVLDHAGNHLEHGPITDEIEWPLDGKPRKAGAEPTRTCPACFAIVNAAVTICPMCGAELGAREEADDPGVDNPGELVKFTPAPKATREEKESFYLAMVREASGRGYTVGWARFRYRDKFGTWPRLRHIERDAYLCPGHVYTLKEYGPKRVERCEFCYDEQWVSPGLRT